MNSVPIGFMVMALVAVAIFALVLFWCIREIVKLDKHIYDLETTILNHFREKNEILDKIKCHVRN